mgnify:CR=1 FL=1
MIIKLFQARPEARQGLVSPRRGAGCLMEEKEMRFEECYARFWDELGASRVMVLSTSLNDIVTSRTMSVVMLEGRLFFQTDRTFRKYEQIKKNPHVALCADNIQIEGECEEVGRPLDDPAFCLAYERYFPSSFRSYSMLENERLFAVTPSLVERWRYVDDIPYMERFDVETRNYIWKKYDGR